MDELSEKDQSIIQEVIRIAARPGEILVVRFPDDVEHGMIQSFRQSFRKIAEQAGFTAPVMMIAGDIGFEILSSEEAEKISKGEVEEKKSYCDDCDCGKKEGCGA